MLWEKVSKVGDVLFGCALFVPFVGLAAFFLGANTITIVSAAVVLLAFGIVGIFEDLVSLLMVPMGLVVGGIGAFLAWIFGWNILACAAFAVCLVSVLVLVLFFLMIAKLSAR